MLVFVVELLCEVMYHMFGAIYGDIIGSYYEVHCTKNDDFPLRQECHFTDDSVLIAAVCKAILNDDSNIHSYFEIKRRSKEYAAQYRQYYSWFPNAGFGEMFSAWAKDPHSRHGKSYANGAAMRVIPIAYAYQSLDQVLLQVKASCIPTHNHHEAIIAAKAVAVAVYLSRFGESKAYIKTYIEKNYKYNLSIPLSDIKKTHTFNSRASYSVPPAIIAFLESTDYESAIRNAVSLGGDADTQACIAGGIAEAYYHKIPEEIEKFCRMKIDSSIKSIVNAFSEKYVNKK